MNIQNHLLKGDNIFFRETPNKGGIITPQYLIFHYTAGRNATSSVDWLCNAEAGASAHLVVSRDGQITQLAPFNLKTWHAGISHWDGLSGINNYAIGIELSNAGLLTKTGSKFKSWFQAEYPKDEVLHARHKFDNEMSYWHAYTQKQIEVSLEIAALLVREYNLKNILGHDDIAPDRKKDPGPAFPMENLKSFVFGREKEQEEQYEVIVDQLNIRQGPGIEYDPISDPLIKGTKVILLENWERWSKVDVGGDSDIQGWVYNKYIHLI